MADQIHSTKLQDKVERNVFTMFLMLAVLLSVGGLVEIVPLFLLDDTMEHNKRPEIVWQRQAGQTLADWKAGDGVRPYTALELAGRDVYIREGCYTCHSQMIRPFRDEKERYGHYSLASESMYDHPFQWGSKRTGPDLHRVGAKYPSLWHVRHMDRPDSTTPGSVMPRYPHLLGDPYDTALVGSKLRALRTLGVPYTDGEIETALASMEAQARTIAGEIELQQGPRGLADKEIIALTAYLQRLGTDIQWRRPQPQAPAIAPLEPPAATTPAPGVASAR